MIASICEKTFVTMSFSGKVVLVTGASSGIGAATAILFAKEGADVIMVARNQAKLKAVNEKVNTVGKNPLVIIADLAKETDINRVIKQTIDKYGKLDVLVNNAGFAKPGSVTGGDIMPAYDATMAVNIRAVIHLVTLAVPHLKSTKGNIINISSVASVSTPMDPKLLPYYISKAALDSFTKGLAKELAPAVRVNSVNPGPVVTDFIENSNIDIPDLNWDSMAKNMTALERVSQPDEIADLITFLASDKAKGITGSVYITDNGYLLKTSS